MCNFIKFNVLVLRNDGKSQSSREFKNGQEMAGNGRKLGEMAEMEVCSRMN